MVSVREGLCPGGHCLGGSLSGGGGLCPGRDSAQGRFFPEGLWRSLSPEGLLPGGSVCVGGGGSLSGRPPTVKSGQ